MFGAADRLTNDYEIVGRLVGKLPASIQWEWSKHLSRTKVNRDGHWDTFREWLKETRDAAHQSKIISMAQRLTPGPGTINKPKGSSPSGTLGIYCYRCGQKGHHMSACTKPAAFANVNCVNEELEVNAMSDQFLSDSDQVEAYERAKKRFGYCPLCKQSHEYEREIAGEKINWPSSQLRSCDLWLGMDAKERGAKIEEIKGCFKCTSWLHQPHKCWRKRSFTCGTPVNGKPCRKPHDPLLHNSKNRYCMSNAAAAKEASPKQVMLEVQSVLAGPINGQKTQAILFYDKGSTVTLVTHRWAKLAKLKGEQTTIWLRTVNKSQYEQIITKKYVVELQDKWGETERVEAIGLDSLSHIAEVIHLDDALTHFPQICLEDVRRPNGEADILVGMDFIGLHPTFLEDKAGLRLMSSRF